MVMMGWLGSRAVPGALDPPTSPSGVRSMRGVDLEWCAFRSAEQVSDLADHFGAEPLYSN